MSRFLRLALLLVLLAGPGAAQGDDGAEAVSPQACEDMTAFWPLWRALPGPSSPDGDRPIFPKAEIMAALQAVPLGGPLPPPYGVMEYYRPPAYTSGNSAWQQILPYAKAAIAYEQGDFAKAISQFDAVVQGGPSPYRAAAAYTAARAAFLLGDLADGTARVDRILADPGLKEFWLPSWQLIARMRYQTDAAPLAAAQMAQISRLLTLPTSALCDASDPDLTAAIGPAAIKAALADFYLVRPQDVAHQRDLQQPGFDYARRDPVIELIAHAPAYPQFEPGGVEPDYESGLQLHPGLRSPVWPALPDAAATPYSRARWAATGNPLWALALGYEGEEADLPALSDAILAARSWPDLSDRARAALVVALSAYRARILLRLDQEPAALAALAVPSARELAVLARDPPDLARGAVESLVNGGTRYLLARHRRGLARHWAIGAAAALHWPIAEPLKPLLADTLDELYRHPALQLAPVEGEIRLGAWRGLFDSWSSAQMIDFARRDEVAPIDRRALVGAAWIRAFALRHWDDVLAWLPDLRRAYPMLAPEIDRLGQAWLPMNQRHLALYLALRAPGLVALPGWSRPPGSPKPDSNIDATERPTDIRITDPFNPSDGNWWCTPDVAATLGEDHAELLRAIEQDVEAAEPKPASTGKDVPDWEAMRQDRADRYAAEIPLLQLGDGQELQALSEAGSSAQRFAEDAIAWGRDRGWFESWFGSDAELPETLHRAVQATRIGCRSPADNSAWSKAAFRLLHRRYPNSDWTKRTPYWFGVIDGPG